MSTYTEKGAADALTKLSVGPGSLRPFIRRTARPPMRVPTRGQNPKAFLDRTSPLLQSQLSPEEEEYHDAYKHAEEQALREAMLRLGVVKSAGFRKINPGEPRADMSLPTERAVVLGGGGLSGAIQGALIADILEKSRGKGALIGAPIGAAAYTGLNEILRSQGIGKYDF